MTLGSPTYPYRGNEYRPLGHNRTRTSVYLDRVADSTVPRPRLVPRCASGRAHSFAGDHNATVHNYGLSQAGHAGTRWPAGGGIRRWHPEKDRIAQAAGPATG